MALTKRRPTARAVLLAFRRASPEVREKIRSELHGGLNDVKEFGSDYYAPWNCYSGAGQAERLFKLFLELLAEPAKPGKKKP